MAGKRTVKRSGVMDWVAGGIIGVFAGAILADQLRSRYIPLFTAGSQDEADQVVTDLMTLGIDAYRVDALGDFIVMVEEGKQREATGRVPF